MDTGAWASRRSGGLDRRPGGGSLVQDRQAGGAAASPGKRTLTEPGGHAASPAASGQGGSLPRLDLIGGAPAANRVQPSPGEEGSQPSPGDEGPAQGVGLAEGVDAAPDAGVLASHGLASSRFAAIEALHQVAAGLLLVRQGSPHRDAVAAIQAALEALGFPCGGADGAFGANTDGAVRRFQTSHGLSADGVVGPLTLGALDTGDAGIGQSNQADSRLGHNTKTVNGKQWDPERSGTIFEPDLPFLEGGGWDHATILARWSQQDNEQDVTTTDDVRCSVNSAMAVRIVAGPQALVDFTRAAVAEGNRLKNDPATNPVQRNNIELMLPSLSWPIVELEASIRVFQAPPIFGQRVALAGYRTLDSIANAVKVMLTLNPHGLASIGISDTNPNPTPEAENIFTLGTGSSRQGGFPIRIQSRDHMKAFVDALRPGEAWLLAVDLHQGDPTPNRTNHKVAELDHGITLGREPLDKGGRVYLYDPAPKAGSQIFFVQNLTDSATETGFWPYFEVPGTLTGGASVFKHTLVLQATRAL